MNALAKLIKSCIVKHAEKNNVTLQELENTITKLSSEEEKPKGGFNPASLLLKGLVYPTIGLGAVTGLGLTTAENQMDQEDKELKDKDREIAQTRNMLRQISNDYASNPQKS